MPAAHFPRQAGVSPWFETGAGRSLLSFERRLALEAMLRRPSQPWLWLAAGGEGLPRAGELPGRGLRLLACGDGHYRGDVHCRLPLPLPAGSLQAVVVQHAAMADVEAFVAECARVLAPGGRLWLFVLNPYSPQQLRWRRPLGPALPLRRWRRSLQAAGLYCPPEAQHYLGPVWRAEAARWRSGRLPWRMACLLEAEKRTGAPVLPVPAKVRWPQPVATI